MIFLGEGRVLNAGHFQHGDKAVQGEHGAGDDRRVCGQESLEGGHHPLLVGG